MALNFPNPSRSYDASRHCVCFWGYDGAREVAFQVTDTVLSLLSHGAAFEETAFLDTSDRYRDPILTMARDIYTPNAQHVHHFVGAACRRSCGEAQLPDSPSGCLVSHGCRSIGGLPVGNRRHNEVAQGRLHASTWCNRLQSHFVREIGRRQWTSILVTRALLKPEGLGPACLSFPAVPRRRLRIGDCKSHLRGFLEIPCTTPLGDFCALAASVTTKAGR